MKRVAAVAVAVATALALMEAPASGTGDTVQPRAAVARSFTLVSSGDILLHERTWTQAQKDGRRGRLNFDPQFADVKPVIAGADLALCHLETPIAALGKGYRGYPMFNVPPQIIGTIKRTGFDMCGTASNHSFDAGSAGIRRTLDALDRAGIKHTGSARSRSEANTPLVMTVQTAGGPVKVGILSYTFGFNGIGYPGGRTWAANKIDPARIIAAAQAARAAGAEVVVAKIHWGTEYTNRPNGGQRRLARKLAASGQIDLIDGDHPHAVQPITKIKGMWVAYSHGNLVAAHREPRSIKSEGIITRWTFTEGDDGKMRITKVEFVATLITDTFPVRVLNAGYHAAHGGYQGVSTRRLRQAVRRTTATVNAYGPYAQLIQ